MRRDAVGLISHQALLELFSYDKSTGLLTRKVTVHYNAKAGDVIKTVDKSTGYIVFNIKGKLYHAHRVAWFYVTSEWPDTIDHINGIKTDNRWDNLRDGTMSQNHQNIKVARKHNQSGLLGAHAGRNGNFDAVIIVCGKRVFLGTYSTALEAHLRYLDAKRQLHEFNTL